MPAESPRRRPASLAARVTGFVGLAITLMFFVFGWLVVRSLEHHFAEQDASELAVVAESVQRVLDNDGDATMLTQRLARAVVGHHGVYFHVADSTGRAVYTSPGPALDRLAANVPPVPAVTIAALRLWTEDDKSYRGAVLSTVVQRAGGPSRYTVVVATVTNVHQLYIRDFQRTLWVATLVMSVIALLTAWMAVQQGHAPLRRISARMRDITSEQLHMRLHPQEVPIELSDLVDSFNAMLGRIEAGFRQLSNFSADIAHELRTPITNLNTQTQVALSQARGIEEYREVLYSNLEEFDRLSKMIGDMLFLAQTDNDPRILDMAEVDLAAQIRGLFDYFEAWAENSGVALELIGATKPLQGDPLMLRRALANLLSNAIRHTPHEGKVRVLLASTQGTTSIRIENPGPTIGADHLPRLFDRFYRVDPSRQRAGEGSGLGLAIVKSIVELHQGEVCVTSQEELTCFEIKLPTTK